MHGMLKRSGWNRKAPRRGGTREQFWRQSFYLERKAKSRVMRDSAVNAGIYFFLLNVIYQKSSFHDEADAQNHVRE